MVIIAHKNEFVNIGNRKSGIGNRNACFTSDNPSVTYGDSSLYTREPLEGSAASIVARQKEARIRKAEKLMDDMSEDFPQLKNIYEMLKQKG